MQYVNSFRLSLIIDLNNSSHSINLFRCRKHNLSILKRQVKAWLTAQTNGNSIWMIILDRFVGFQWKNYYIHSKTVEQTVPLYLLKWKLLTIVRPCSCIHSHKELAQATRSNAARLSCNSTTLTYSGCHIKIIHFLQARKTAPNWEVKMWYISTIGYCKRVTLWNPFSCG